MSDPNIPPPTAKLAAFINAWDRYRTIVEDARRSEQDLRECQIRAGAEHYSVPIKFEPVPFSQPEKNARALANSVVAAASGYFASQGHRIQIDLSDFNAFEDIEERERALRKDWSDHDRTTRAIDAAWLTFDPVRLWEQVMARHANPERVKELALGQAATAFLNAFRRRGEPLFRDAARGRKALRITVYLNSDGSLPFGQQESIDQSCCALDCMLRMAEIPGSPGCRTSQLVSRSMVSWSLPARGRHTLTPEIDLVVFKARLDFEITARVAEAISLLLSEASQVDSCAA